jgi:hypothetical protein
MLMLTDVELGRISPLFYNTKPSDRFQEVFLFFPEYNFESKDLLILNFVIYSMLQNNWIKNNGKYVTAYPVFQFNLVTNFE